MRRPLLAALLLLAALPVAAETYKWVDAKGVVNYSNTPPASASPTKASQVEERLSTYESDPALGPAAAASAARSAQSQMSADAEWLQRQRLMAFKDSYAPAYPMDDYYAAYYPGYYAGFPIGRRRPIHAGLGPHPAPRGVMVPVRTSGSAAPRGSSLLR
jgi:hypothetical protein